MKEDSLFKHRLLKGGGIFLSLLMVFTVISKTIYIALLPQVQTEKITSGRIETRYLVKGKIGYDLLMLEAKKVEVTAPSEGEIVTCHIQEMQEVKKGEKLFTIRKQVDEQTELQSKQQLAEIEMNQTTLQREQSEYQTKKKRLQVELQEKQLESPLQGYDVMNLDRQIESKAKEIETNEALYQVGAIAKEQWQSAQEDLELLKEQKEELIKQKQETLEKEIKGLQESIEQLNSQLAALTEKMALEENKLLTHYAQEGEVEITSPIDGIVYEIDIAENATAMLHDQLTVIVPHGIPVTLSFNMGNETIDKIQIGESVTWMTDQKREEAKVIKKSYDKQTESSVVTCEVEEALTQPFVKDIKTYKAVDVEVIDASDTYEMLVNTSALVHEGMDTYIYTIEKIETTFETTYKVHKNLVTIIEEGDYTSAINGALDRDVEIVKRTNKPLKEGMEVSKI